MWKVIAKVLSRPRVADWLIERAQRTPYTHIYHGDVLYMGRWWLFNPYPVNEAERNSRSWWRTVMPSVRIHHIAAPDAGRDWHDHPWDARTIILKGGYIEHDETGRHMRLPGDTKALRFGEYHTIPSLLPHAYTLFITWKYQGTWGFLVNGKKVPHKEYKREGVEQ